MKTSILVAALVISGLCVFSRCNTKTSAAPLNVDSLVRKMTEASGGDSAIGAIRTHVSEYESIGKKGTDFEEVYYRSTITFKRPSMFRMDIFDKQDSLTYSAATNGEEGWEYFPKEGARPIHKMKTAELVSWAEHWIDEWRIYKEIELDVKYVGEVAIRDTLPCYKMFIKDRFGIESYWYVDKKNLYMARIEYPVFDSQSGRKEGHNVRDFVEYKDVDVMFPTQEVMDGKITHTMHRWRTNAELSDTVFMLNAVNVPASSRFLRALTQNGGALR